MCTCNIRGKKLQQISCQPEEHFQQLLLFILNAHRCNRLHYRTASMRYSVSHTYMCDKQASTTTNIVRVYLRQRAVIDANHRGGWTRTFGGKASEPEQTWPVKKQFYLSHLQLAPPFRVILSEFLRDFFHNKTTVIGLWRGAVCVVLCWAVFVDLRLVTDGQTDRHAMTANIALALLRAGKNHTSKFS